MHENLKIFFREFFSMASSIGTHLLLLIIPASSQITANNLIITNTPQEFTLNTPEGGGGTPGVADDDDDEEIDLFIDLTSFRPKKNIKKVIAPIYPQRRPRNTQRRNLNNIKIDQRGIYRGSSSGRGLGNGTGRGSGGATLNIPGWTWDSQPVVNDTSNEVGKITFEFKIDDLGYVISIKTIEKTVSNSVERLYRDAVLNLTFKKIDKVQPQEETIGRITFILQYSE